MRRRRPATSFLLIGGGLLLLAAIAVGQRLGDRVLRQATEQRTTVASFLMTPVPPSRDDPIAARNWKHEQVVSVATDPAFPDPRATPKPTATPRPTPVPTLEPPLPEAAVATDAPIKRPLYTSPALPIPIASHAPDEVDTEPPDVNGYPQGIPPVTPQPVSSTTP